MNKYYLYSEHYTENGKYIARNVANRKNLRKLAKHAISNHSNVLLFAVVDKESGDMGCWEETQGSICPSVCPQYALIAQSGGVAYAFGTGEVCDNSGNKITTQKEYLLHLLGDDEYQRIFGD